MTGRRIDPDRLGWWINATGTNTIELAARLQIAPGYLRQIRSGERTLANNSVLRHQLARIVVPAMFNHDPALIETAHPKGTK